jgi:chemotaxis protein histidine kinase CheA
MSLNGSEITIGEGSGRVIVYPSLGYVDRKGETQSSPAVVIERFGRGIRVPAPMVEDLVTAISEAGEALLEMMAETAASQAQAQKPQAQKPQAQKPQAQEPQAQKPQAQKPQAQAQAQAQAQQQANDPLQNLASAISTAVSQAILQAFQGMSQQTQAQAPKKGARPIVPPSASASAQK